MEKEQHNNNKADRFSQLVRSKLEGHELPVDDRCWLEIEERLNRKRRTAIPLWTWASGVAVSVAVVVLLSLLPTFSPAVDTHQLASSSTEETAVAPAEEKEENPVPEETTGQPSLLAEVAEPQVVASVPKRTATTLPTATEAKSPAEEEQQKTTATAEEPETPETLRQTTADSSAEQAKRTDNRHDKPLEPYTYLPEQDWQASQLPKKQERKNGWLIGASFNTGGRTLSEQKDMLTFPARTSSYLESSDGTDETVPQTAPLLSTEGSGQKKGYLHTVDTRSFSRITHLPPISAGLRVRKDFGKHFALESGLTYTYLHSQFNDDQIIQREASLRMHYLGVPLNAVVYLVNKPKWNVYFLAGGMVEKGLQASYTETTRMPGVEPEVQAEQGKIAGVQWSLNASFGISYQFYKGFGIYFEPNIAYYLKNNQPLSARTENPLIVGLNAGIRYRIK